MKKIRCAIYTRKSAEEGLEQEFNSLDAQREACAAYCREPVLSKNTNELKTGAPGRFGSEASEAWLANGS